MTLETIFHVVQITVTLIGFLIILLKGGIYIGRTDEILRGLKQSFNDFNFVFNRHIDQDNSNFREVKEELNEIKIEVASIKNGPNNRQRS